MHTPTIAFAAAVLLALAACEPAEDPCIPNNHYCSADGLQTLQCNAAGTGKDVTGTCDAELPCAVSGGIASCAAASCTPNQRFCLGADVWGCSAAGAPTGVVDSCTGDQICAVEAGVATCVEAGSPCTAGAVRCASDGLAVEVCDAAGRSWTRTACDTGETCVVSAGAAACVPASSTCAADAECDASSYCDLDAGECRARICTPGARSCVGDDVHACDSRGAATALLTECTGGQVCSGTAGNEACRCAPNASRGCFDGDVYVFDSCGVRESRTEDCTEPETCTVNGDAVTCELRTVCSADAQCPTGSYCDLDAGECRPRVCTPGARSCVDGDVHACDSRGAGAALLTECTGGQVCSGTPGIESCRCAPNASRGCHDGDVYTFDSCGVRESRTEDCTEPETCTVNGDVVTCELRTVCSADAQCPTGSYCDLDAGECRPRVCIPGARSCVDGDVHACDSRGAGAALLTECTGGQVCSGTPGIESCRCAPNASRGCHDGDVYTFDSCGVRESRTEDCTEPETCTVDGEAVSCELRTVCSASAQCPTGSYCDLGAGECRPRVCTPGARSCGDDGVYQCDAQGSAIARVTECTGGQVCSGTAGNEACRCVSGASLGCHDGDVYVFDSCGVRGSRTEDCTEPETCTVDGAAVACELRTVCSANAHCPTGSYCDLGAGECRPRVCTPGTRSCGDDGVYECDAQGSAVVRVTECTGGQVCSGTAGNEACRCVSGVSLGCHDGDVYNYDSCGARQTRAESCNEPEICHAIGDTADCALRPVCESDAHCLASHWCDADGACRPDVCVFGPVFCSGAAVVRCLANGSGYSVYDTCVGGEVCVDGVGIGADCRCENDAYLACYSTEIYNYDSCGNRKTLHAYCTAPEECQMGAGGVPFCSTPITCAADTGCAPGDYCDSGLCAPQVCAPTTRVCDGDRVLRCNSRGSGWEAYDDCTGGEVCDPSGAATCRCVANAWLGCYGGNVARFDSCGNYQSVAQSCGLASPCAERPTGPECRSIAACDVDGDCDAGEYCDAEVCLAQVCAPNATFCDGQTIRRCDARGADSALVTDCGAGELCGASADGPRCGCEPDVAAACGTDGHVHAMDSCGREGAILQTCEAPLTCVPNGVGASCSDATACGNDCVCAANGDIACVFGDVYTVTSCNEPANLVEQCAGQIACNTIGGDPACRSSVADPDAPYYERSCSLVHQIAHPTTLAGDCRCSNNRVPSEGIPECVSAQYLDPAVSFGSGPRVRSLPQSHVNGGFFDAAARELVVGVDWSSAAHPDAGLVMAIDVDSGDRRIISGGYPHAAGYAVTGSGPSLHQVIDVQPAPGGTYLAVSVPASSFDLEIVRIAPATGNRTLVWRAGDAAFAQCPSGDPARVGVQVNDRGFAVDAEGRFYLGFANTSPYGEGLGIVRIAADGGACTVVTRSGTQSLNAFAGQDVGAGYVFDRGRLQGFVLKDGGLYAIANAYLALVRVDLATGARSRISSAATSWGVIGSGPTSAAGIGHRWLAWDAARDLMWASGNNNRRVLTAVDLTTGDRTEAYCQASNPDRPWRDLCLGGALIAGYQNEGGLWIDTANGDLLIAHEAYTLVRVDVRNGNSIKLSL